MHYARKQQLVADQWTLGQELIDVVQAAAGVSLAFFRHQVLPIIGLRKGQLRGGMRQFLVLERMMVTERCPRWRRSRACWR